MRPSQTILVLEALRDSLSSPLYRKGVELSSNDRTTVLEVYQQWLLLLIDLGYLSYESLKRDAQRLLADMASADVLTLNNAFAELLHLTRCKSTKGFKALCGIVSPHLYHLIKRDLAKLSEGDVYSAKRLMQAFSYTSRLSLNDIDLTQQCLDGYMDVEAGIQSTFPVAILQEMNSYIRSWMKSFDPTRLHYQHGPGGVAGHGRTSLEVKYKDLTFDPMITYVFGDPWWSVGPVRSSLDRISQTIFVPKSYKTFRTISMEPATLQYLQQGIWREMDRVVSVTPFLRRRIGFHEQDRNRRLAKEGSINRSFATIDLSAASDSVSYALVKEAFKGTPLLPYLMATRSRRTLLPDGQVITLKKFAPMGSALCFPIETIIFAAICQCVTRSHGVPGDYSVFGDDIIVPTQCAGSVMSVLEDFGFCVNREKSFFDATCWFRESCGSEFCDGFDVTPMRVSRKYSSDLRLVQAPALVDLANSAYRLGYRNLRGFFLHKMRSVGYKPLFGPNALLGDSYTNYHTETRWNKDLHRWEVKVTRLEPRYKGRSCESIRYRHWLESTHDRGRLESDLSPSDIGWLEEQYDLTRNKMYQEGIPFQDIAFRSEIRRPTVLAKERWMQKPYDHSDQVIIKL